MKTVFCKNCGVKLEVLIRAKNWACPCCRSATVNDSSKPVYEACFTHPKPENQPEPETTATTPETPKNSWNPKQRVIVTRFDGSQFVLTLAQLKKRVNDREFLCLLDLGTLVDCSHIYEIENEGYIQAHCLPSEKFCP